MVNKKGIENLSKTYDKVYFTNTYQDWKDVPVNCEVIDVVNMLTEALDGKVQGMAIVMRGTHMCKTMRGVKNSGQMTVSYLSGCFKEDPQSRQEFYKLIDQQKD